MDSPTQLDDNPMETVGWARVIDQEPNEDAVGKVESILSPETALRVPPFIFWKGGTECKDFLNFGNQVNLFEPRRMPLLICEQIRIIVENYFRVPFSKVKKQGPAIVKFDGGASNQELRPMRAHPIRNTRSLSIFRPLRQKAEWSTGLFKVISTSHGLKEWEFENGSDRDVHEVALETNQLLVVSGGLYVQPSPNFGGQIVWQGFSLRIMEEDIYSPRALPFMKIVVPYPP